LLSKKHHFLLFAEACRFFLLLGEVRRRLPFGYEFIFTFFLNIIYSVDKSARMV